MNPVFEKYKKLIDQLGTFALHLEKEDASQLHQLRQKLYTLLNKAFPEE